MERIAYGQHRPMLHELGRCFSSFSPPSVIAPLQDWFEFFYAILFKEYRCEYVYKNAIARKLFLKHRNSFKDSLLTNELRVGNSRADVVILNGTSTVYEVKSEYDSFERLDSQISDYRSVFDRIFVVTTADKAQAFLDIVDPIVGVMILKNDHKLDPIRNAQSNKENTDPATIFDCMRQAEFCSAVKDRFGFVPDVPNSKLYLESKKLFCKLDPVDAHDLMVQKIRTRKKRGPFIDLIKAAPDSLKHACLSFTKSQALAVQIRERLKEPFSR